MNGEFTAWQMRCGCEAHHAEGACTRQLAISRAGNDVGVCKRVLKRWALLADEYPDRDSHRAGFNIVIDEMRQDLLPSDEALDAATR